MRTLAGRKQLSRQALERLKNLSESLMRTANPAESCELRFNSARSTKWFRKSVKKTLIEMSGASRTCMFCDHNEPTDVEHFKPKTVFPIDTFNWDNMLWVCTTCNRLKSNRFPPDNCTGAAILNPIIDSVWDFFLLDEFGNLVKHWDVGTNAYDARAQSTCDYVYVDREEIQTRRQKRMKGLKLSTQQALNELDTGTITIAEVNIRVSDWLAEPYQADVADYCFRGPGRVKQPFSDLLGRGVAVPAL
jgi:uncharacterized protein (TIGR02646 family)